MCLMKVSREFSTVHVHAFDFHFCQMEHPIPAEGAPSCDLGTIRSPLKNAQKTLTTQ